MLSVSSLAALSVLTATITPFPVDRVEKPLSQRVAILNAPATIENQTLNCKNCENFNPPNLRFYEMTPERRALLNTIRFAEGTWKDGDDIGYRVMFGGSLAQSLQNHPDRVNHSKYYSSSAAGAYQFMPSTWSEASRKLSLKTFEPENQDQAALYLIERRGALSMADKGIMTPSLANKLAPEWASLPTYSGRSYYGQPVKGFKELSEFYNKNLESLRNSLKQQEKENA